MVAGKLNLGDLEPKILKRNNQTNQTTMMSPKISQAVGTKSEQYFSEETNRKYL
eukprot:CAMPEP_0170505256 /NCGR_PEP_ID=MMETSP0208-20121228/50345_1 /TAXON_ID=197538 /ORGANISM="Strombidium inclinatum, Strain S3" /LENGTH=53 /DNA_ID=CAMNT_0010786017 /DNA_START=514 /DNA_END=675 /DNA_ORIENTATION=-